jgi:hypothetical protein
MKEIIDLLFHLKGSHTAVARALGYTGRQYRNIRKKVESGERLHPRVETFILVQSQIIQGNSPARNILSLTTPEKPPQTHEARS